jgi:prolycopene isomerase
MRNVREGFEAIEAMTLDGSGDDQVSPMLALKYPQFVELVFSTYDELLDKYVKSDELKGLIANLWWYFGLPPSELAAILYSVPGVSYIEYSGGYIKGTSQQLSNALADIIVEHGGEIRLDTRVTKILQNDGTVDGVLVDEGEVLYADVVVSNAGARNTFMELLDDGAVKKKYFKKIRRLESSLSAVQLYLGLDCTIEALGIEEHSFTAFFTYDHEEAYQKIIDGRYEETFFSCMAYTSVDETLAPPGKGIVHIFSLDHIGNWEELSPKEYENKKKVVTNQIFKKVEAFIPELGKHVVVSELGTPMTMRRYTSNPEGAVFGPSQIVTQSGLNRFKPETPIEGLYLVGSSIYPGGGYPSVISSGYRVANAILNRS